ncbi:MAG TPA: GvpL/GvpF family gas vesicle protein [Intrasporangium sp.]|uniref:GvpL/GvpF family gas vesicle protein n=1 Tax=Nocardioides sp. TaxID=35761 RepID=UPI002E418F66|nr:GvpL/GvpF family gas vesicle protein [Intrasporangium sp.]
MTSAADVTADDRSSPGPEGPEVGWFVYGVVGAGTPVPQDLTGLDEGPVRTFTCGRVAAVATQIRVERPPGRGVDLLAYHSVLDALAQGDHPVLPVRFGAVVPDEVGIVEEFLAPDEAYFAELLESLAGRSQLMFQAVYDERRILSEIVESEPEIAELRALTKDLPEEAAYAERVRLGELVARAVEARREMDAAALLDEVLPMTDAHVLRPVSGVERVVDAAVLVHDQRRDQFENRLERLAEEHHERMRLRLMGPTAPYDFAGGV